MDVGDTRILFYAISCSGYLLSLPSDVLTFFLPQYPQSYIGMFDSIETEEDPNGRFLWFGTNLSVGNNGLLIHIEGAQVEVNRSLHLSLHLG